MPKAENIKIKLIARTEMAFRRDIHDDMPEEVAEKLCAAAQAAIDAQLIMLWLGPAELERIVKRQEERLRDKMLDEFLEPYKFRFSTLK